MSGSGEWVRGRLLAKPWSEISTGGVCCPYPLMAKASGGTGGEDLGCSSLPMLGVLLAVPGWCCCLLQAPRLISSSSPSQRAAGAALVPALVGSSPSPTGSRTRGLAIPPGWALQPGLCHLSWTPLPALLTAGTKAPPATPALILLLLAGNRSQFPTCD